MTYDAYIFDSLLPDIIGHDRRPAAFVIYLVLYRRAARSPHWSVRLSHQAIADATGFSRSAVQASLAHLQKRQLVNTTRPHPTAIPQHRVLRPWLRLPRGSAR